MMLKRRRPDASARPARTFYRQRLESDGVRASLEGNSMRKMLLASVLAATTIATGQAALAQPNQCFFVSQWEGWKAPDDHTIYLNIIGHRIYRLDLAGACPELTWPDVHLVSRIRGGDTICRPLDFDLKVAEQRGGPATPCIVKNMTLLTPDEAAALPRDARP